MDPRKDGRFEVFEFEEFALLGYFPTNTWEILFQDAMVSISHCVCCVGVSFLHFLPHISKRKMYAPSLTGISLRIHCTSILDTFPAIYKMIPIGIGRQLDEFQSWSTIIEPLLKGSHSW